MSDSVTPWTVAYQASPSMGFSRQEYESGCHFLLQGIVPTQGSNLGSPALQADALPFEPPQFSVLQIPNKEQGRKKKKRVYEREERNEYKSFPPKSLLKYLNLVNYGMKDFICYSEVNNYK